MNLPHLARGIGRRVRRLPPFAPAAVPSVGTGNERTRIEWLQSTLQKIPSGSRLLDAGAGEQQFKPLCAHLEYVSQDVAEYDGQGDDRGLQTGTWDFGKLDIVCDITGIPEPDNSFDAVLCTEVFEHLPEPALAIKEFGRLVRPGGYLVITAPFCSLTHFAPYHYGTGYSRYYYELHLPAHGFEIVEISENGNYFEYLAQELHRLPRVATTYARDRLSPSEQRAVRHTLQALSRFSGENRGSQELLHFGFHVFARKLSIDGTA